VQVKVGRLPTTYSNAELGEKQLGFGGVLVFCDRVSVGLLDKSIGNQPIKSEPFICIQIFGPFHAPSGHDVAKDSQFFVGDGDGFCHLTAPMTLSTVRYGFTLGPSPAGEVLQITPQKKPGGGLRGGFRAGPLTPPGFNRMVNAVVAKLGIKAHAHMLRHVEKIILTPPPTKNGALCTSTECRCLGGLLDSNEAAGLE
jgi:hypothetical protein